MASGSGGGGRSGGSRAGRAAVPKYTSDAPF